jgi:hypothetical protein
MSDFLTILPWAIYFFACIAVAVAADRRGWDSINVFFISVFASPLITAILYAPYRRFKKEPDNAEPESK